jgi:phosphoglycolate phosphatase/pyrophosphatase PpaX
LDSKELGLPVVAAAWASTTDSAQLKPLNPDWLFYSVEKFKDWIIKQFKEDEI